MQVIIPLAGKGTRLRPHTHLVPKPLLKVAGRPVMDWVMDRLEGLDITELIFITGHLKEQVEEFARTRYRIPSRFIEQKVQDGTAGAINLARPYVTGPVLIIFVDTVFEADLTPDQPDRRRRDHLGQGGGGLSAVRRGGHRCQGLHDPDRGEAFHADLQARQHRALLHQGGRQPVAGHRSRARPTRPTRASGI